MTNSNSNRVLIPGELIRSNLNIDDSFNGVYRDEHGDTYASLICIDDQLDKKKMNYMVGGLVFGVVNRIIPRRGVEVRLLDKNNKGYRNEVEGVIGLIRPQDIGCWNMNSNSDLNITYSSSNSNMGLSNDHIESQVNYWMNDCFRPGDIVKCSILSVIPQILLSTNSIELGCIFTPCINCRSNMAYPISYNAVLCNVCKTSMLRKTAKPKIGTQQSDSIQNVN